MISTYRKIILTLFIFIACFGDWSAHAAELSADQAFMLQVDFNNRQELQFTWQIAPKHYLYKNQINLINANNAPLLDKITLPSGKEIHDPVIGAYIVYGNKLHFSLPWTDTDANRQMILTYQGCSQDSFCYLPVHKLITIDKDRSVKVTDTKNISFPDTKVEKLVSVIQDRNLPITILIFFCLGLLLSFTPCVLPMIPLVVNLIIGQKSMTHRKALILSSSYVLGMAGSYTVAGIIAGLLGESLQAWLQQPAIIIGLSIFLVIMALAQFDLIRLKLPHFNKRLHQWGQKQIQGSIPGAFILGILAALIVSPCITPPLIGVLTYISQNGNPYIGGVTLLSLGLGMGAPLILVAVLSNMILPKAGAWMNIIKNITGIAILGLAIWLLQRIISAEFASVLWAALSIITAVQFKIFKTKKQLSATQLKFKYLGWVFLILGIGLILYAFNQKLFNPHITRLVKWHNIVTSAELQQYLDNNKTNRETIVEFYANWCTSCKKIEANVFGDTTVQKALTNFNLLRVDLSDMTEEQQQLLRDLEIFGPPTLLFFDQHGMEIKNKRVVGDISIPEMLRLLTANNDI